MKSRRYKWRNRLSGIKSENVRKRKNFFPTLLITIFLWSSFLLFIFFIDPVSTGAIPVFFILLFISSLFLFSVLLGERRKGLIIAVSFTSFAVLRYFGVGNILNGVILIGITLTAMLYLH